MSNVVEKAKNINGVIPAKFNKGRENIRLRLSFIYVL